MPNPVDLAFPVTGSGPRQTIVDMFKTRMVISVNSLAELRGNDFSGHTYLRLATTDTHYKLDPLSTEADDGSSVIHDSQANRFVVADTLPSMVDHKVEGVPDNGLGSDGQLAFDVTGKGFYLKEGGVWVLKSTIRNGYDGTVPVVNSMASLTALDISEHVTAVVNAPNRNRHWFWADGDYTAHHAVDTLQGYFAKADGVASNLGSWVAERDSVYDINIHKFGVAPCLVEGTTEFNASDDMQPAIQSAIDLCILLFGERNRDVGGRVIGGVGYFKIGAPINLRRSIVLEIPGALWYTPTTGRCVHDPDILLTDNQHEGYRLRIGEIYAVNGNNDIPASYNAAGNVGCEIKRTQNSDIEIGHVTRFTKENFDFNSSNDTFVGGVGQHNQGTRIKVGYSSYGGCGINQRSDSAEDGAAQVCNIHVGNLISNFTHIRAGASGDTNSSDCIWQIDAMELPAPGGKSIVVEGDRHKFGIDFLHVGSSIEVTASANDNAFDIHCASLSDFTVTDNGTSTSWKVNGDYVTYNADQSALNLVSKYAGTSASGSLNIRRLALTGDNAFMNGINFQGWNSASGEVNFANLFAYKITETAGNENGQLKGYTTVGGTSALRVEWWQGQVMAGATGGDKGPGTINATGVFDDNALLACYVFDAWFAREKKVSFDREDVKEEFEKKWDAKVPNRTLPAEYREVLDKKGNVIASWKVVDEREVARIHEPMRKFTSRIGGKYDPFDMDKFWRHIVDKRHIYAFPNEDKYDPVNGAMSQGEWQTCTVEVLEVYATHIRQLHMANKALEKRLAKLEGRRK